MKTSVDTVMQLQRLAISTLNSHYGIRYLTIFIFFECANTHRERHKLVGTDIIK